MFKHIRILVFPLFLLGCVLAFAHAESKLKENARLQGPKHRIAPFLALLDRYDSPLTAEPILRQKSVDPAPITDERTTLRDSLALLLVTTPRGAWSFQPGGILFTPREVRRAHTFGRYSSYDPERTRDAVLAEFERQANRRKTSLLYDEGEGGYVQRIGSLPSAWDLGSFLFREELGRGLEHRVRADTSFEGRRIQIVSLFDSYAAELVRQGIQAVYGPAVDVPPLEDHTASVYSNERCYSRDYDETLYLARLYTQIMKRHGLRVVGKHFLNMGTAAGGDLHDRYLVDSGSDGQRRASVELYRSLLPDLDGIMLSHLGNPDDGDLPYSISPQAISTILEDLGFQGIIVTDAVSMEAVTQFVDAMRPDERQNRLLGTAHTTAARTAVLAIDAGAHVIIAPHQPHVILDALEHAFHQDTRFRANIREALRRYVAFAA